MENLASTITFERFLGLIEKHKKGLPGSTKIIWNWDFISQNKYITPQILENHPDKPWNWRFISRNSNINIEFIHKYSDKPWDWGYISEHVKINLNILTQYKDKPWNFYHMSQNNSLTLEIIEKYPNENWNWFWILENPNIPLEDIHNYKNKPEELWNYYCYHKDFTVEFVNNHPELNFTEEHLYCISCDPKLTMETIEKYPDFHWDWGPISEYIKLTPNMIDENIDKPWQWDC